MYYKDIKVTDIEVKEFFSLKSKSVDKYTKDNLSNLIFGYLFDKEINWEMILPYIALNQNNIRKSLKLNNLKNSYRGYLFYKLMAHNISIPQHQKELICCKVKDIFYLLKLIQLKPNRYHKKDELLIQFSLCFFLLNHQEIEKDDKEFFSIFYTIIFDIFSFNFSSYTNNVQYYLRQISLNSFSTEELKRFAEVCLSFPQLAEDYFYNLLSFNTENEYSIALTTLLTNLKVHRLYLLRIACTSYILKDEDRTKILIGLISDSFKQLNTYKTLLSNNTCISLYKELKTTSNTQLDFELFIKLMIILEKDNFLYDIKDCESVRIKELIQAYFMMNEFRR